MLKTLRKLFKKPLPHPKPKHYDIGFLPTGITLEKWREATYRIQEFREWAKTQFAHDIFSCLQNAMPTGYPLRGSPISSEQALIELGRKEGYADCLRVLTLLSQYADESPEPIESTYEPETPPEEEKE